jgi:hypothetical protein
MRTCLVFLIVLMTAAASGAPAWRWVDETGQVHYSDRPVPGAEQIDLPGAQAFPSPALRTQGQAAQTVRREQQPPQATERYRVFEIVRPSQQETLWNIGAVLNVQVALEPALQPGHVLDVYLDGQRRNLNITSTEFSVPDVFRGVHTMQAVVLDAEGDEVVRSLAVTFMVQQTSILNPNNPNAPNRAN